MSIARLAGVLVLAAAVLLALTLAIAMGGGSVSVRGDGPGSLALTAALVLLGGGLALLAIAGPRPFNGRMVRTGFALVVAGGSVELATANVPPESLLVVVFLLGGVAVLVGVVVAGIGLLRAPGRPRWVGVGFVSGLLLVAAAGFVANDASIVFSSEATVVRGAMELLAVLSAGLMIAGLAGIGVLAITTAEPAARAQSAE